MAYNPCLLIMNPRLLTDALESIKKSVDIPIIPTRLEISQIVKIPEISLNQIVLEGEEVEAMAFGPAIIESSLESKNVIIAGHRDSFFRVLQVLGPSRKLLLCRPKRWI